MIWFLVFMRQWIHSADSKASSMSGCDAGGSKAYGGWEGLSAGTEKAGRYEIGCFML